jgi:hypothetical protein
MSDQETPAEPRKEKKPPDLEDKHGTVATINPNPTGGGDPPTGEHGEGRRPRQ